MSDRLTPERENEIRGWLDPNSDLWPEEFVCDELYQAGQYLLAELDACRRDLAEERARTTRLTEALEVYGVHLTDCARWGAAAFANPPCTCGLYAKECGAGTEQPA